MVHFVGAGPGAPDLITLRGKTYLEQADVIIYAGSLVNPQLLDYAKEGCQVYNSAKMTLRGGARGDGRGGTSGKGDGASSHGRPLYVRGNPGADGRAGREWEFPMIPVPGVSSFCGAACCAESGIYTSGCFPERDYHPDGGAERRCRRGRASSPLRPIRQPW